MEQCLRKIEIDYGLQQLTNSWERHKNNNIIQPIELQEKIDKALSDSPCLSEWIDRLELSEVNLKFRITSQGHVQGISYIYQSKLNKGSDIDRGWRFICSKFDKIPQNLESMRLANLKTQSLLIELRQEDDELMAKTANLAMQKLNGLNRFKDKSVIVSLIDGVLKIQRLRPNKIVLSAQKNLAGEWKSLGIPNIDPEKDLRILET